MIAEYFQFAYKTFMHEKKRTFLTLIGIFIGIAAVVSLISLGQGLEQGITKQFEVMGTNKIFVQPGTSVAFGSSTTKLTQKDLNAIKNINGVESAGASSFKIASIEFGGQREYTFVIGADSGDSKETVLEAFGLEIINGRTIEKDKDVVVGYRVWSGDFFDSSVSLGDKIEIEDVKYNIVGLADEIGNPQDDSQLYVTFDSAQNLFDISRDEIDFILVSTKESEQPSEVAEKIKKELRKTRDVEEDEEDFIVQTSEDFLASFGTILTIVQVILISIAGISLLVGGVNIANTMYTAVMERTKEIGIMKAIGARNSDIFFIFLIEAGILGVIGGLIGIIAGVLMSKLVSVGAAAGGWSFIQAVFPWYLTVGAFLFSFIVGALAGTLPAIQASKMKPVDALRYE